MKIFTVRTTATIAKQLRDSPDYYTQHIKFDREFLCIYTKKIQHYTSAGNKWQYSVKESHKPQGMILTEGQFSALFMIPEEAHIPYLIACQNDWRRDVGKRS